MSVKYERSNGNPIYLGNHSCSNGMTYWTVRTSVRKSEWSWLKLQLSGDIMWFSSQALIHIIPIWHEKTIVKHWLWVLIGICVPLRINYEYNSPANISLEKNCSMGLRFDETPPPKRVNAYVMAATCRTNVSTTDLIDEWI